MSTDHNDLGNSANKIESTFPISQSRFATRASTTPYALYTYAPSNPAHEPNGVQDLHELKGDEQLLKTMHSLFRACQLAQSCNRPEWDFAVEVQELRVRGVSTADLRWLMANGWVEHRLEVSNEQQANRQFEKTSGFKIGDSSCFQLTEIGKELAEELKRSAKHRKNASIDDSGACLQPSWDCIRHELRLGNRLVKKFKWRAQNQEAILSAFEEESWPARIDDPLPPVMGKNPKRRLSDAIKCLNRHQSLSLIRFSGDGTGEGVLWERVESLE